MKLSQRVRRATTAEESRSAGSFGLDALASMFPLGMDSFNYNGTGYGFPVAPQQTLPAGAQEPILPSYVGIAQGAFQANSVVFSCMAARQRLFSEARFQFRRYDKGRPGDLFGTPALGPLEAPWPGATTSDLLQRMMADGDIAGNAFIVRRKGGQLRRLRPDWVTIVTGSKTDSDIDSEVVGYAYHPKGDKAARPEILLPEEVAHWAPIPDPVAKFRGMSWLMPLIRTVMADQAMTAHKLKFFENGATPNMVVTVDKSVGEKAFFAFKDAFEEEHAGVLNAYKTLMLGGGANVTSVGSNMQQIDFTKVSEAGELRIASAAGVPPMILGIGEKAPTYNNYSSGRRHFADATMRPLWRSAAACLAPLIAVPSGAELWYDDRDIPFLQEDLKDAADIGTVQASTIGSYITQGFTADSAVKAVMGNNPSLLVHSGLVSVQLQAPGAAPDVPAAKPTPTGETKPSQP